MNSIQRGIGRKIRAAFGSTANDSGKDGIRWGIVGAGQIARKMADAIEFSSGAELHAIGSRTLESANAFARDYGAKRAYGSYEELYQDPDVDVVYVATPHPMHAENTLAALEAGKAVLCEKPLAMNAAEAEAMVASARAKGLFLMEAMWTRFLPAIVDVKRRVVAGEIGDLRMLHADFGFRTEFMPEHRLFNPALGGGALLDVGIYPVSLAHHLLGVPSRIHAEAAFGPTGTDEQTAVLLGYPDGQLATLTCAARTRTAHEAILCGADGLIRIRADWWSGSSFIFDRPNGTKETVELSTHPNGFLYEVEETVKCLREGKTESSVMSLDESLEIMRTMDTIQTASLARRR